MGVAGYNTAASVSLITAQRLVRQLCNACRQPQRLHPDTLRQAGWAQADRTAEYTVYAPLGCSECHKGFKGRTGIFQIMPVGPALQELILQDASVLDLTRQARLDGMRTLREAGLRKVMDGTTSLDEVLAATRNDT
jgi:type IV pilus assembly protein PilB